MSRAESGTTANGSGALREGDAQQGASFQKLGSSGSFEDGNTALQLKALCCG